MKRRTGQLDHPTLDELSCLILHEEGTKGYNAEVVMLQQLYGFAMLHGWGRLLQMAEGMYDIWSDPEKLKEYQRLNAVHLAHVRDGIRIFESPPPSDPELPAVRDESP